MIQTHHDYPVGGGLHGNSSHKRVIWVICFFRLEKYSGLPGDMCHMVFRADTMCISCGKDDIQWHPKDVRRNCFQTQFYNVLHKICPIYSYILEFSTILFCCLSSNSFFSTLCGMIPADFGFVEPEHAEHAGAGRGSTAGHAEPFLCSTRGRRSFQIFRSPCDFRIMWSQGSQPYDRVQYVYRVIYKLYIYTYICEIRWFQMTLGWFRSS